MLIILKTWEKANLLRFTPDAIVNAPGLDGCYAMYSLNKKEKPHLVTSNGKVVCHDLLKSVKFCSHALAGSDMLGCIEKCVNHHGIRNVGHFIIRHEWWLKKKLVNQGVVVEHHWNVKSQFIPMSESPFS